MSANVKCFNDAACTQEIQLTDEIYSLRLAPMEGINGDAGQVYKIPLYLKNVGTRAALNTRFIIEGDEMGYISIDPEFVGDMKEREVKDVVITVTVPRWTRFRQLYPQILIDYYTLPEITEIFHNPYVDKREVVGE